MTDPKKLSTKEFAAKIKEKYPQYKDIDDNELTQKILEKYPQYESQVSFDLADSSKKKDLSDSQSSSVQEPMDTGMDGVGQNQFISDQDTTIPQEDIARRKQMFEEETKVTAPEGISGLPTRIQQSALRGRLQRKLNEEVNKLLPGDVSGGVEKVVDAPDFKETLDPSVIESGEKMMEGMRKDYAEKAIENIGEITQQLSRIPESESRQELNEILQNEETSEWEKLGSMVGHMASNPSLTMEMMTESIAQSPESVLLSTLGAGIGGPLGLMAGNFLANLNSESVNSLASLLSEEGVDISSPEALMNVFQDKDLQQKIKARAGRRAGTMATVDSFFTLGTMGMSKFIPKGTSRGFGQALTESGGEFASEMSGMEAAKAGSSKLSEAGLEALVSAPSSTVDAIASNIVTSPSEAIQNDLKQSIENTKLEDLKKQVASEVEQEISNETASTTDTDGDVDENVSVDTTDELIEESAAETAKDLVVKLVKRTQEEVEQEDNLFAPITDDIIAEQAPEVAKRAISKGRPPSDKKLLTPDLTDIFDPKSVEGDPKKGIRDRKDGDFDQNIQIEDQGLTENFINSEGQINFASTNFTDEVAEQIRLANKAEAKRIKDSAEKKVSEVLSIQEKATLKKDKAGASSLIDAPGKLMKDLSQSMQNLMGEITTQAPKLRSVLYETLEKPMANILLDIDRAREGFQAKVNEAYEEASNTGENINDFKLWVYGFLNDKDTSLEEAKGLMLASLENEYKDSPYKVIKKGELAEKQELVRQAYEAYKTDKESILNPIEKKIYNAAREYYDNRSKDYQTAVAKYFNKFVPLHEDYMTRVVAGGSKRDKPSEELDLVGDQFFSEDMQEQSTKVDVSGRSMERIKAMKQLGTAYYNTSFESSVLSGIASMESDIRLSPYVKELEAVFKNKDFQNTFGKDNVVDFKRFANSFIRTAKGRVAPAKVKSIDEAFGKNATRKIFKAIATVKGAYLAAPSQFAKQLLPAIAQVVANGNPVKALQMAMAVEKTHPSFIDEHVPGLRLRQQNLSHLIESHIRDTGTTSQSAFNRRYKRGVETLNSVFIQQGDYLAAKAMFFSEYARLGGSLDNPNPEIIAQASINQQRLQGVNNIAFAPISYNPTTAEKSFIMKTIMAFTMFPLNQTRQIVRGMRHLKDGEQRRLAGLAMVNLAAFAAVSEMLREGTDELYDMLMGEDDEDDKTKNFKDFATEIALASVVDGASANLPLWSLQMRKIGEYANKKIKGDDYNAKEDRIFYTYQNEWEARLGPVGGVLELIYETGEALTYSILSGDNAAMQMATLKTLELSSVLNRYVPKLIGKPTREAQKRVKEEYKEFKEALKGPNNKSKSKSRRIIR